MHSSKNVEVEVTREQLSDKRAGIHKGVFIKGREETVEDVIVFIANTVCFDRFGIQMTEGDETPILSSSNFSFRCWMFFCPQLIAILMRSLKQVVMNTWLKLLLLMCSTFFRCSFHTLNYSMQFNVWRTLVPWIHDAFACLWWFTNSKNLYIYRLFPVYFYFLILE